MIDDGERRLLLGAEIAAADLLVRVGGEAVELEPHVDATRLERLGDGHLLQLSPPATQLLEHALQLARQILHAGRRHDLHLRREQRDLDLDLAVVELALTRIAGGGFDQRRAGANFSFAFGGSSWPLGLTLSVVYPVCIW